MKFRWKINKGFTNLRILDNSQLDKNYGLRQELKEFLKNDLQMKYQNTLKQQKQQIEN